MTNAVFIYLFIFIWLVVFLINYVQARHREGRRRMLAAARVWVCEAVITSANKSGLKEGDILGQKNVINPFPLRFITEFIFLWVCLQQ